MIFELRHYVPAHGKRQVLLDRFRSTTNGFFKKHGFVVRSFWTDRRSDDIWYLLEWRDSEQRRECWTRFQADPEWAKIVEVTEADGPLVDNVTIRILENFDIGG